METSEQKGIYVAPGEGRMLWVVGDLVTLKTVKEDTSGVSTLMEQVTPPGGGPPPHMHTREDETFCGLEEFFEEVGEPVVDPTSPPPGTLEDIEKVVAVAPQVRHSDTASPRKMTKHSPWITLSKKQLPRSVARHCWAGPRATRCRVTPSGYTMP